MASATVGIQQHLIRSLPRPSYPLLPYYLARSPALSATPSCHWQGPSKWRRMSYLLDSHQDTIYAPATAQGKAAISIVRIAGPHAEDVYHRMTAPLRPASASSKLVPPPSRTAQLRLIRNPDTNETLDQALALFFPPGSSPTGDPTLELHLHGSPAVLRAVLGSLSTLRKELRTRPAERGEFTRRAFENGKMDLTEVEGLKDLVEAETEEQRKLAVRGAGGHQRKVYTKIRSQLVESMALCEAIIDFAEDANIEEGVYEQARAKVIKLRATVAGYLDDSKRGEVIRSGIRLAIFGAPNAGKSTLLNWLAQREASIVSPHPGTTRDVIELSLDFHGFPILVSDTAGLRSTTDEIETIGIARARTAYRVDSANVKLCLASLPDLPLLGASSDMLMEDFLDPLTASLIDDDTIYILTKQDLTATPSTTAAPSCFPVDRSFVVSVQTGEGLTELVTGLTELLQTRSVSPSPPYIIRQPTHPKTDLQILNPLTSDPPLITTSRHRHHLTSAIESMDAFLGYGDGRDLVVAVEELREASNAVGRVLGRVDVEEVLGEIFRGFVLGNDGGYP